MPGLRPTARIHAEVPEPQSSADPALTRQGTGTVQAMNAKAEATIAKLREERIKKAGSLAFPNTDRLPAKFAIIPDDLDKSQIDAAVDTLMEVWKLEPAKVLISVTGGAAGFKPDKRLRTAFERGLEAAVRTTKAWVITGGTKCGCMELVGKTLERCAVASACLCTERPRLWLSRVTCHRVPARRTSHCWASNRSYRYTGALRSSRRGT